MSYNHHFLAIAGAYLMLNARSVFNYLVNLALLPPGTGKVYKKTDPRSKKKHYYVNTDIGTVRVPHYKTPSLEMEVYFFKNNVVGENKMLSSKEFRENYADEEFVILPSHDLGVIGDVYYPKDFRGSNIICGFISNILEDCVFVFKIENEKIDYLDLFAEYERRIEYLDLTDDLD